MNLPWSGRKAVISVFVAVVLVGAFVHWFFLFNPLTFERDHVTYLPWHWYRGSIVLEVYNINTGEVRNYTDREQIRSFVEGLKEGAVVPKIFFDGYERGVAEPILPYPETDSVASLKRGEVNIMVVHFDSTRYDYAVVSGRGGYRSIIEIIPSVAFALGEDIHYFDTIRAE